MPGKEERELSRLKKLCDKNCEDCTLILNVNMCPISTEGYMFAGY